MNFILQIVFDILKFKKSCNLISQEHFQYDSITRFCQDMWFSQNHQDNSEKPYLGVFSGFFQKNPALKLLFKTLQLHRHYYYYYWQFHKNTMDAVFDFWPADWLTDWLPDWLTMVKPWDPFSPKDRVQKLLLWIMFIPTAAAILTYSK